MKYGILGTGDVAYSIGSKLIALEHEVTLSSRNDSNEKAEIWAKANGERAFCGVFSDASRFGERIFLCVRDIYSTEVCKNCRRRKFVRKNPNRPDKSFYQILGTQNLVLKSEALCAD